MSKKSAFLSVLAIAALFLQSAGPGNVNSGIVDNCKSTISANAGVVLVCPIGDGDPLTAAVGGVNAQITLTVRDNTNSPIANVPAVDMWLVGCNDALMLCGGSQGSNPDGATDASGVTHFSNEPVSGGCDTGIYGVLQGKVVQNPANCVPVCLAIATRSPDYKSAGAPGPAPCGGDLKCPDSRVTNADFSWFVTHYPTGANPGAPFLACADYATPLGSVTLADFTKFSVHFAGAGHKCPI
ncbi:MAG TPA: hypothetical protein VF247_01760 [Candidatus Krumholzibacteria bacterium]